MADERGVPEQPIEEGAEGSDEQRSGRRPNRYARLIERLFFANYPRYRFTPTDIATIVPRAGLVEIKVPDATPGIILTNALGDEQAILAKVRYNRLVDLFLGVVCYSLQSHLRTFITDVGQVPRSERTTRAPRNITQPRAAG